jgi:outer membrane protein assembly factor BamB
VLFACAIACGRTAPPPAPALFPLSSAWSAALESPIEGALVAAGGRVLVHTRDGAVQAFSAADGRPVWRTAAEPGFLGGSEEMACLRSRDGTVRALAPDTGTQRWSVATGIAGDLPPVVQAGRVLVAGQGIAALDAASGQTLWSVAGGTAVTSPPALVGPCVLLGESEVLRCREAGTGRSQWEHRARGTITSPPVSDGREKLFLGTAGREFLALDLADGGRDWRWKVGADVRWPAVLWRDLVLFATHENVLYALKRKGGNLAWRAGLPSRPFSAPLLVGNDVLIACYGSRPEENFVVGFDALTGERLGDLRTPGELAAAPVAAAGRLFLPLRDRRVVAMQLPAPPPAAPVP